jgi:hypothetical protein
LYSHESSINYLGIIEETGHLVSHSNDGEILFWDYPSEKIVKVVAFIIIENKIKKIENSNLMLRRRVKNAIRRHIRC